MLGVFLKSCASERQRQLSILGHGTCDEKGRGGKYEAFKLLPYRSQAECKGKVYLDKSL